MSLIRLYPITLITSKGDPLNMKDVDVSDTKITDRQNNNIRDKVATLMAQGLNATEIQKELKHVSKKGLIRVLMDCLEHPISE
jgi:hypothetical protein